MELPSFFHRGSRNQCRAAPIVQRGAALGRWLRKSRGIGSDSLAPYAEQFVEELIVDCHRAFPGREFTERVPSLPRPKELKG